MLPLTPIENDWVPEHSKQRLLDQVLYYLPDKDTHPFCQVEWARVLTPGGVACTCMTLDVFDRPVYLLVDDSYARVHLQTPLLKGLKADQVVSALAFLECIGSDLAFKAAPRGTLAVFDDYPFDMFVKHGDILLSGFCNKAREAALLIREHLVWKRRQQAQMELAA